MHASNSPHLFQSKVALGDILVWAYDGVMKWSILYLAIFAFSLIFALYLAGYFAVIERRSGSVYNHGFETLYYSASARVGGTVTEGLYYPVIRLDRLLRPQFWAPVARELPDT